MNIHSEKIQPLVSVIIPTYNRPDYLKQAIESVLQQTYRHLEVIVTDDCSAENPQAAIDALQDKRVRLRRNSTNLGVGLNAKNAAIETKGKYVACLNDDDLWESTFLEKLVACLEHHSEAVLAFCDYSVIDSESNINPQKTEEHAEREKRKNLEEGIHKPFWSIGLIDRAVFCASAALVRREAVEWSRLHEAGVFWDYYIVYLACRSGQGAYYLPERLARYRVHPQSENMLSGSRNAKAKVRKGRAEVFCYEQFLNDSQLNELSFHFKEELANANATLGIGLLRMNQVAEARSYLFRSLQQKAFNSRAFVALGLSYMPQNLAAPLVNMRNRFSKYSS